MSDPIEEGRRGVGGAGQGPERRQVAVIGSGGCGPGSEAWELAGEVGRLLAEAGVSVVCGALGGVMEAAAAGASGAGGTVIGVAPWTSIDDANRFCTHVVATGVGQARNVSVVASGQAAIAVGGEWGTLSEIGHARSMGRTVVALRSWALAGRGDMAEAPGVVTADTPAEAVAAALAAISG